MQKVPICGKIKSKLCEFLDLLLLIGKMNSTNHSEDGFCLNSGRLKQDEVTIWRADTSVLRSGGR